MMQRVGGWIGVCALAAAMVGGCDVFDPALLPQEERDDDPDVDSGPDDPEDGCTHGSADPPPRPPDDTEGDSVEEMIFALKDVVLSNASVGLNVDGLCTGPEGPWSCLPEPRLEQYLEGGEPRPPVDGPLGIDNVFADRVFDQVNFAFSLEGQDLELTSQIAEGRGYGNPLIVVRDYNGTANDPRVTVIVSQSVFGVPSDTGEAPDVCVMDMDEEGGVPHEPHDDDGDGVCAGERIPHLQMEFDDDEDPNEIVAHDPAWDEGNLWFWARDDTWDGSFETGSPLVEVDTAYVNDWQLVVRLPDNQIFNLVGEGQAVQARLMGAYAVADLKPDYSGTEPGGVLVAGRWSINALLETAQSVGICPGDPLYNTADDVLTGFADVRTRPEDEGTEVACNAVSFGITFTAHRAKVGGLALGQPIPNPCAEEEENGEGGEGEPEAEL